MTTHEFKRNVKEVFVRWKNTPQYCMYFYNDKGEWTFYKEIADDTPILPQKILAMSATAYKPLLTLFNAGKYSKKSKFVLGKKTSAAERNFLFHVLTKILTLTSKGNCIITAAGRELTDDEIAALHNLINFNVEYGMAREQYLQWENEGKDIHRLADMLFQDEKIRPLGSRLLTLVDEVKDDPSLLEFAIDNATNIMRKLKDIKFVKTE